MHMNLWWPTLGWCGGVPPTFASAATIISADCYQVFCLPLPSLVYQATWSTSSGINNSMFPVYMIVLITQVFSCESSEEMTLHVESCLSKSSSLSTAAAENDGVISTEESNHSSAGESDEDYETYTWCGQTRIRATTMLGMPPCLMA